MAGEERQDPGTGGGDSGPSGDWFWMRRPVESAYGLLAFVILATAFVATFTIAHDVARQGGSYDVRSPAVDEFSSVLVVVALLPFLRWVAAILLRLWRRRVLAAAFALASLVVFFVAHIAGMVALRYLVASLLGTEYRYPWTLGQLLYEFRKDALSFVMITITFLLALRLALWRVAFSAPTETPASPDLWLRDGATSVRIDAREITWVGSAGNYIEYHLAGGVTHLIRGTLAAEEARLLPHRIVRIHRTRLVNLAHAVAVDRKATGDFEVRLNTGETVVGSRRYRGALEHTAAFPTGESAPLNSAKGA